MSGFYKKLAHSWRSNSSLLCVGLDPDFRKIPESMGRQPGNLFRFNCEIIDATAGWSCAFKPQAAFYHAVGAEKALQDTIDYIHTHYPEHVVVLDAKRGDIGSTAEMYALEAFDRYGADAVTVNPYMGGDTLVPFLEYSDKGVFILCKTSNEGSGDLQDINTDAGSIYSRVAQLATESWNVNGNIGLVVGATYASVLGELRGMIGEMPMLVPGIGSQGGDLEQALNNGLTRDGFGLLINASRSIMYAGGESDFAVAAANAAEGLCNRINRLKVQLREAV